MRRGKVSVALLLGVTGKKAVCQSHLHMLENETSGGTSSQKDQAASDTEPDKSPTV